MSTPVITVNLKTRKLILAADELEELHEILGEMLRKPNREPKKLVDCVTPQGAFQRDIGIYPGVIGKAIVNAEGLSKLKV